ncbi:MAG: ribosomal protein L7/L12 [Anaerolineales bacterium]
MSQSLNCPNCSAPLDLVDNSLTTIRCPYCHTSVIVPEELHHKPPSIAGVTASQPLAHASTQDVLSEKVEFIKEMALAGNKMIAVKALRDVYEISLPQARELVEAMARGETVDTSLFPLVPTASMASPTLDPSTMQRLLDLIRSGEKIEAIKLFRQATGVGLKDAKDAIDGMEISISASPVGMNADMSSGLNSLPKQTVKRNNNWATAGCILFLLLVTVVPILIGMASQGGPLAGVWARLNPFTPGRVTLVFGKEGTGPGYFNDANFIALDNNGHIFVGEDSGGRVQVFDDKGKYLTQWIASGEETGDIYLAGMAAGRDGSVYTVVGSQLYVYDGLNGNLLGRLEHPDGWGFDDVTLAPDGSVIAAWYKNRDDILRFNRNGNLDLLLENAIENVTGDSEMDTKVAVDGNGNMYALAYFNEAVFVFSADGRYITRFGSKGDEKGQFTSPSSIAVDNLGRIYIDDFPGVMIYSSDGRYLDTLPVDGAVMGMTFDDQNNLFLVADNQVLRFKLK